MNDIEGMSALVEQAPALAVFAGVIGWLVKTFLGHVRTIMEDHAKVMEQYAKILDENTKVVAANTELIRERL
jgi:hypothetical protein